MEMIEKILVSNTEFDFRSNQLIGVWVVVEFLAKQIREEKRLRPDNELRIYKNSKDAYGLFSSGRASIPTLLKWSEATNER